MITLELEGSGVERLDQEAGGHRVQRVPPNERRGRVHSSTVTVFVRQEGVVCADPGAVLAAQRAEGDFERQWYSGSGAGGQHRNKHQNSVRLRHLPTGIVVTAQCRSRVESLRLAQADLLGRLDAMVAGGVAQAVNQDRTAIIGTGMRADKRRTWRFQDDQVLDHVTGKRGRCTDVLRGRFEGLWS